MLTVESKIIRTKKKFNFDTKAFITQALGIINRDITEGIADRRQIDGSSMPSLEPITIRMKEESQGFGRVRKKTKKEQIGSSFEKDLAKTKKARRAGVAVSPDHPLIDTGVLMDERSRQITIEGNEGTLRIKPNRAEIGKTLQIDGVGRKGKTFKFFGISKEAEEKIRILLNKRWKESFEITRGK